MPGWSRKFGKASMLPMDGSKSNDGRSAVIQVFPFPDWPATASPVLTYHLVLPGGKLHDAKPFHVASSLGCFHCTMLCPEIGFAAARWETDASSPFTLSCRSYLAMHPLRHVRYSQSASGYSLQASCTPFAESAGSTPLACHAFALRCPVLTWGVPLSGASIFLGVKSVTPLSCVEISMLSSSKTWYSMLRAPPTMSQY